MNILEEIRAKVRNEEFEFSRHATDRMLLRHIAVQEIRETIASGEIIEDYPNDKYGPSCLILGYTSTDRALHIQCSYPVRSLVKIITTYEPNDHEWINYRVRRQENGSAYKE